MTPSPTSAGAVSAPDSTLVVGVVAPVWWLAAALGLLAVVAIAALGTRRDRRAAAASSPQTAAFVDLRRYDPDHGDDVPSAAAHREPATEPSGGDPGPTPSADDVPAPSSAVRRQAPLPRADVGGEAHRDAGSTREASPESEPPSPAPLGLWVDREGRIVGGSGGRDSFVGRHPDALVGSVMADLVHGLERPRLAEAFDAACAGRGVRAELELPVRTSAGWRGARVVVTGLGATDDADAQAIDPPVADAPVDAVALVEIAGEHAGGRDCSGPGLAAVADLLADALADGDDDSLARRAVAGVRTAVAADTCELFRIGDDRLERRLGVGPGGVVLDRRITSLEGDTIASFCARAGMAVGVPTNDPSSMAIVATDRELDHRTQGDPDDDGVALWTSLAVPVGSAGAVDAVLVASCLGDRRLGRDALSCLDATAGVLALASRRRGAEAVAFHRARHDELTGLVNRDVFVQRLDAVLTGPDRGESIGVAIIDLDHFQLVNDSLGHTAGDELISAVGNRLHAALRPGDLLARFGGDEFIVMSRRLNRPEDARLVGNRILSALAAPFEVGGEQVRVTASVGVAVSPAGDETAAPGDDSSGSRSDGSVLVQQADAACSRAKHLGRERVEVFEPSMQDTAVARLRTASELQSAIADGQLRVFYQPMVDLSSGRVAAVEALVRWAHPGRGLVVPADFIPLSETSALIEHIGRWVVGEVTDQLVDWRDSDTPLRAAINVSRRQLLEPRLLRLLDDALGARDLDPASLIIEVSEHGLVAPDPSTQAAIDASLEELAARGISITIDRFGTGAGSLPLIRRLPIETVKLDRDLVGEIATSGTVFAVVSGLVRLARDLGKRVVASGVENEAQLDLLRELGVDLGQGHLFSPAVHRFDQSRLATTSGTTTTAALLGVPENPFA